jgi:cytochrome c oxidase subunit II
MSDSNQWARSTAAVVASATICVLWLAGTAVQAAEPGASTRTFDVTASRYQFAPARIEVAQGDTVRLVLHSSDTEHGIEIKELNVKTLIPKGGAPVTVEFVADKAGTFQFKCSRFCGVGHGRMKGELVVVAR